MQIVTLTGQETPSSLFVNEPYMWIYFDALRYFFNLPGFAMEIDITPRNGKDLVRSQRGRGFPTYPGVFVIKDLLIARVFLYPVRDTEVPTSSVSDVINAKPPCDEKNTIDSIQFS